MTRIEKIMLGLMGACLLGIVFNIITCSRALDEIGGVKGFLNEIKRETNKPQPERD